MFQRHEFFTLPMTYFNKQITELNNLPEAFNSFFSSVFRSMLLTANLQIQPNDYVLLLSNCYLTPNYVLAALPKVKPKYNSPDGIPGFFLKTFAPLLVKHLTTIFNESLLSATMPVDWKHAIITPFYKGKSNTNDITNYRPISCTSVTGKVLESLVKSCSLPYFLSNFLLTDTQFSFIPGHSTTSNLLYTDYLIHNEVNCGNAVDMILFDISKAFDTVPHSCLLNKLTNTFGIKGKLLSWIKAFLIDRMQSVKILNYRFSQAPPVLSEVIQDSIIVPIL